MQCKFLLFVVLFLLVQDSLSLKTHQQQTSYLQEQFRTSILISDPTACEVGKFYDNFKKKCSPCYPTCSQCFGPTGDECTACSNFYYRSIYSCVNACSKGTFQSGGNNCEYCNAACEYCYDLKITTCSQCKSGFIFDQDQCSSPCLPGYFNGDTGCSQCSPQCSLCFGALNTECIECNVGFSLMRSTTTCNETCSPGYYSDTDTQLCQVCPKFCQTCQSLDICLTCRPMFYLEKGTCVFTCSLGSSGDNQFRLCCPVQGYFINQIQKACVKEADCGEGEFLDIQKNSCQSCVENCVKCIDQKSCLNCKQFYLFDQSSLRCELKCDGYLAVTKQGTKCQACHESCQGCHGPRNDECMQCQQGFLTLAPGICSQTCPQGQWADRNTNYCVSCNPLCKSCLDESSEKCQICSNQALKYQSANQCLAACPTGETGNNEFQICCKEKTEKLNLATKLCEKLAICHVGEFLDVLQNICLSCIENCEICSDKSTCNQCQQYYLFDQIVGQCKMKCKGYLAVTEKGTVCEPCDEACENCNGPRNDECVECKIGYFKINDFTCVQTCPPGMWAEQSSSNCIFCNQQCQICLDKSPDKCLTCAGLELQFQSKNDCYSECPKGEYADNPWNICCQTGIQQLDVDLKSCIALAVCQLAQFRDEIQNICFSCVENCLSCANAVSCLTCRDNYVYDQVSNQCQLKCEGYLAVTKSGNKCQPCNEACLGCRGPRDDECLSCQEGFLTISPQQCRKNCSQGQWANRKLGICQDCNQKCKICLQESQDKCLVCSDGSTPYQSDNQCFNQCPVGKYGENEFRICCKEKEEELDLTSRTCKQSKVISCQVGEFLDANMVCRKCMDNCVVCKNADSCLNCKQAFFYDESKKACSAGCEDGYMAVTPGHSQCEKCNDACSGCFGPKETDCQHCANDFFLMTGNLCTQTCPIGTFSNTKNRTCDSCSKVCKTCFEFSPEKCIECSDDDQYQFESNCVPACPQGYDGNNQLKICCRELKEILNEQSKLCEQTTKDCSDGQFLDQDSFTCKSCLKNCLICTNQTDCQTCIGSYKYSIDQRKCQTNCNQGFYLNVVDGSCQKCQVGCKNCIEQATCETCLEGYYLENTFVCKICNEKCSRCFGGQNTECYSCRVPFMLSPKQFQCDTQCDPEYSQSTDQGPNSILCFNCYSLCQFCSGPSQKECTSCIGVATLKNQICSTTCQPGKIYDITFDQCVTCDDDCLQCFGPSDNQCLQCAEGKILNKGYCSDSCGISQFYNQDLSVCSDCHRTCQSCNGPSQNHCTSCQPYNFLLKNFCLTSCPTQYYANPATITCQLCNQTCKSCSGPLEADCK